MGTIEKKIGLEIRKRRLEKGWTQEALAKDAKISVQTVSILENGKRRGHEVNLKAIADSLGCTETQLSQSESTELNERLMLLGEIAELLPTAPKETLRSFSRVLQKLRASKAESLRKA